MDKTSFAKLLHEYVKIFDQDITKHTQLIKFILSSGNKAVMQQYGIVVDDNGQLVVAEALSGIIEHDVDIMEVIARLSLITLWVRSKNIRKMTVFIHNYIDFIMGEYYGQISCVKGCSFCCNKKVNIFPDEWLLIKENVKHFSPSSGDKCTFLKDNECTIYDIRPVACRNHVVVSPPELCMANSNVENIGDIRVALLISAYSNVYDLIPMQNFFKV